MIRTIPLLVSLSLLALAAPSAQATPPPPKPVLVIGASIGNGQTPLDNDATGPFDGFTVANGSYLDLSAALTQRLKHGLVINEAMGAATTYARPPYFASFSQQLEMARKRVLIRPTTELNADFVVITFANDCVHGAAPDPVTGQPCTQDDLEAVIDRIEAVADEAIAMGLIPVLMDYPPSASANRGHGVDLPLFGATLGLPWVISDEDYETLRALHAARFGCRSDVIFVDDAWGKFSHLGDGLHPDAKTMTRAARRVAQAIGE